MRKVMSDSKGPFTSGAAGQTVISTGLAPRWPTGGLTVQWAPILAYSGVQVPPQDIIPRVSLLADSESRLYAPLPGVRGGGAGEV